MNMQKDNMLLGVSGSVAAVKALELLTLLHPHFHLRVIFTASALLFLSEDDLSGIRKMCQIYLDEDQKKWKGRGEPVLHIQLRKWADYFLIAPLSANTMGKLANGLCDNLLTLVCRCWDFSRPIWICPAMNTLMYTHPATREQLERLTRWGYSLIEPIQKTLICGEVGNGAMATLETILGTILRAQNHFKKITASDQ